MRYACCRIGLLPLTELDTALGRCPFLDSLHLRVAVGLEGGACGITGGGGVGRTYGDLTCGATGFAVVVGAVLYVTAYALDVVTALLVVHYQYHPLRAADVLPCDLRISAPLVCLCVGAFIQIS